MYKFSLKVGGRNCAKYWSLATVTLCYISFFVIGAIFLLKVETKSCYHIKIATITTGMILTLLASTRNGLVSESEYSF